MTTPKQKKYLNLLRSRTGLDEYRAVKRNLGFKGRNLDVLSTREASRLIDALKTHREEKKHRTYTFAMSVYAVQGQQLKLKPFQKK